MLKVINGRLAWSVPGERPVHIDPRRLRQLFIYDKVSLSDKVMQILFEHQVEVAWLSPGGRRCRGRLVSARPTMSLRMLQHQALQDGSARLQLARYFVQSKLDSQLEFLRRAQRNGNSVGDTIVRIDQLVNRVASSTSLAELRGLEGTASRLWFANFANLLVPPWSFPGRVKRPPTDPINALLSLGYTWLTTCITAQLEGRGFEVQLGALHEYRPGRPALSCDVIEPLRVPIVDRWVLKLCNRNSVKESDFVTTTEKGTRLIPEKFRELLSLWDEHLVRSHFQSKLDQHLRELETMFRRETMPG